MERTLKGKEPGRTLGPPPGSVTCDHCLEFDLLLTISPFSILYRRTAHFSKLLWELNWIVSVSIYRVPGIVAGSQKMLNFFFPCFHQRRMLESPLTYSK